MATVSMQTAALQVMGSHSPLLGIVFTSLPVAGHWLASVRPASHGYQRLKRPSLKVNPSLLTFFIEDSTLVGLLAAITSEVDPSGEPRRA